MSCRGISTIGRSGFAALVALAFAFLTLPAVASVADGGISGKVTWSVGGAAVQGAEVCAENESDFGCSSSDINGNYQVPGLEPGSYVVSFEASASNPYVVFQTYPTKVTVASEATTTGIDAAVVKGGAIAGTVVDASNGLPLVGVEVCSWWEEGEEGEGCDYSASDGSFRLSGLHPGLHTIEFWPEIGYEPHFFEAKSILAGSTLNVNAALVREAPAEGQISGNVYAAATHKPLAGIAVCGIWAEYEETGGCTLTNAAGAYGFYPVPAGALKIVFSPEPAEVEFNSKAKTDIWPTQYWNQKPTFAAADTLTVTSTSTFTGIDGLLGPGPPPTSGGSSTTPAATTPAPVAIKPLPLPKPLHCGKGKVKKRVKGKARCVKRHNPRQHHKKHHRHH